MECDSAKDAANLAKHQISLAMADELEVAGFVEDHRYGEPRFRAYGLIHGEIYCLAFVLRDGRVRAISLRRAHRKEYRRHVR